MDGYRTKHLENASNNEQLVNKHISNISKMKGDKPMVKKMKMTENVTNFVNYDKNGDGNASAFGHVKHYLLDSKRPVFPN